MSGNAKRKFLSLDVGEISLVDEPANESPVAVMKRKENENMVNPAEDDNNKPAEEVSKTVDGKINAPEVERIVHETEGDESVLKRLIEKVDELVSKTTSSDKPTTELETEKAKGQANETANAPKEDGIKKSATPYEKEDAAIDTLEALGQVIAKAKSFTPKRMAELKKVSASLTQLLADLDPTSAESAPVEKSIEPDSTSVAEPTEVEKSKDSKADVLALIEAAVTKAVKPLHEEISSLKSTRSPSTAGEDDGDPVNSSEVSTKKSFWAGVLS
jgi:hypothetical protein